MMTLLQIENIGDLEDMESIDQQTAQSISAVTGASLLFPHVSTVGVYDLVTLLIQHRLPLTLEQAISSSQWLAMQSELFIFDINRGGVDSNLISSSNQQRPTLTTLKGYYPLNEPIIRYSLPKVVNDQSQFIIKFMTASTNADLLSLKIMPEEGPSVIVAVAEMQQSGRGRRDKQWCSPLAVNLYFSVRIVFPLSKIELLQSLSIQAGMILLDILQDMGLNGIKLKWPNDLWYQGRKLAGILVESKVTTQGIVVVIGIGVNNQMPIMSQSIDSSSSVNTSITIGNNAISCEAILGIPIDRNILVAQLTTAFYQLWQTVIDSRESSIDVVSVWPEKSYFYGKMVTLWQDQNYYMSGVEKGIDSTGALLVQTEHGIERITSSRFSLRGKETQFKG